MREWSSRGGWNIVIIHHSRLCNCHVGSMWHTQVSFIKCGFSSLILCLLHYVTCWNSNMGRGGCLECQTLFSLQFKFSIFTIQFLSSSSWNYCSSPLLSPRAHSPYKHCATVTQCFSVAWWENTGWEIAVNFNLLNNHETKNLREGVDPDSTTL